MSHDKRQTLSNATAAVYKKKNKEHLCSVIILFRNHKESVETLRYDKKRNVIISTFVH